MTSPTKIEWCNKTWNPVTGCDPISPGCSNCYALRMTKRHMNNPRQPKYRNGFKVTVHPDTLGDPLKMKKPTMIFVNSMSDLFHKDVPLDFIQQVFEVMGSAHWHTFLILTKRANRLAELAAQLTWHKNVWCGVTVESNTFLYRAEHLKSVPAVVRFLSLEPLLSSLPDLNLEGIDWVITGGETGPKARIMDLDWVREIRERCLEAKVPFFFKSVGGVRKPANHQLFEGQMWQQYPNPR